MRKTARQNDRLSAAEIGLLVPDEFRLLTEHVLDGVVGIVVAIGSGKDDDSEFHTWSAAGPHPRRVYLASFGCSAIIATTGCIVRRSANFNSVRLNHRIRQELVGHLRRHRAGLL